MTDIEVDFNSRGAGGTVRASIKRAPGLSIGERVVLKDSSEGLSFAAVVHEIDETKGRVYFSVEWEPVNSRIVPVQITHTTSPAFVLSGSVNRGAPVLLHQQGHSFPFFRSPSRDQPGLVGTY